MKRLDALFVQVQRAVVTGEAAGRGGPATPAGAHGPTRGPVVRTVDFRRYTWRTATVVIAITSLHTGIMNIMRTGKVYR